jgi:general secretion pathway protein D
MLVQKSRSVIILLFFFVFGLCLPSLPAHAIRKEQAKIVQLDFRDISVSDALKVLSQQSNLNFIASQEAAKVHVTMYLKDIAPLDVIDAIAKTYNLWYKHDEQTHVVRIYTVKEYRSEQVEFKQEETETFTLKNAKNALDLADTILNLYGGRVRLSYGQNQNELIKDLQNRFARFDLLDQRTRVNTNLSSGSSSNSGGNSGNNSGSSNNNSSRSTGSNTSSNNNSNGSTSNTNSNTNTNSQTAANQNSAINEGFDRFAKALSGNKEQEGLLAGESGAMDSAITHQSPIYVSVIKHQNRVLVRTRDGEAMSEIKKLYQKLNTESSMMLMEVKILSLDLGDDFNSLFDFKLKSNNATVNSGQKDITTAVTDSIQSASSLFNPALLATVVSSNFEARLQLLEKENRVTELATPILMTTNQEVSRVFIGEERPITTGFTGSSSTTATATGNTAIVNTQVIAETETRSLGTTLLLTPNINADRTVSINILIEQSGLSPQQAAIPLPLGNTLSTANVDVVQAKTFSGTVVAKDGAAIAVGGLISEAAGNKQNKVPVLGDIPGLGFFFRDEMQNRSRQELVVIIKPHIIATPSEASEINQKFMQQNSIHPNAEQTNNMDVYSNPNKQHKGYILEQPFKEYPKQDMFDKYKNSDASQRNIKPVTDAQVPVAQQIYVKLTRYASEAMHLKPQERKLDPKIQSTPLKQFIPVDLLPDSRIKALPIAGWKQGGIYVTVLELHNAANERVTVDYRHLKGHWLAATIENETLNGQQEAANNTTYLYLVSSQPFEEILNGNR